MNSTRFNALFILDEKGDEIAWAGRHPTLSEEVRSQLAAIETSSISNLLRMENEKVQFISIPLITGGGDKVASLHALVDLKVLLPLLQSDQIGESGRIYLLDEAGSPFITEQFQDGFEQSPPELWSKPHVQRYQNGADEHVIGCSVRFGHFGWTLAVEELQSEAFAPRTAIVRKVLVLNLTIILFFSGVSIWLARTISRPIQELAAAARRITNGETDVVIMERSAHDEIALLTLAFNRMSKKLYHNQIELREKQGRIQGSNTQLTAQNHELQSMVAKLNRLSITDGLTNLYNHRYFQQQLRVEIARATRAKTPLFIVLIDIDDFKNLNDHYGHAAGDLTLTRVADIMREVIRENDLLARYGGEEFALVPGQTDLEGALSLAEKIRMAIGNARFQLDTSSVAEKVSVTISVGVAHFTGDLKQSFNHADQALYRAKADGKDCVRLYGVDT
ncbi:MAG: diguanylate cyclase [Deltaproteobacteria bacterium]|nr:diguanylate cyclase [Deltaproteobacteria bacterium]